MPTGAWLGARNEDVTIPFDEIDSVDRIETRAEGFFNESCFQYGTRLDNGTNGFSAGMFTMEYGYLRGARSGQPAGTWGFGATLYGSIAEHSSRAGIKPRVRYRLSPEFAVDVAAGFVFATGDNYDKGFIGSVDLEVSPSVAFKTEIHVSPYGPRRMYDGHEYTTRPGGEEISVYGGIAFRRQAGLLVNVTLLALAIYAVSQIYIPST